MNQWEGAAILAVDHQHADLANQVANTSAPSRNLLILLTQSRRRFLDSPMTLGKVRGAAIFLLDVGTRF